MGILKNLLSYVPTLWATGDVITAEKLNNAENGIELNAQKISNNEVFVISIENYTDASNISIDKTFDEIQTAMENDKVIEIRFYKYSKHNADGYLIGTGIAGEGGTEIEFHAYYYYYYYEAANKALARQIVIKLASDGTISDHSFSFSFTVTNVT